MQLFTHQRKMLRSVAILAAIAGALPGAAATRASRALGGEGKATHLRAAPQAEQSSPQLTMADLLAAASERLAAPRSAKSAPHKGAPSDIDLGNGLTMTLIRRGDNKTFPHIGDILKMHYTGRLKDGTVFDSSRGRGRHAIKFEVGIGKVIEGWDLGAMKMSLGERGILHVPASKAYGHRGAGIIIAPDSDLDFDVELVSINGVDMGTPEAPEQGFEGESVKHEDMETSVGDWRREYGPKTVPKHGEKESAAKSGAHYASTLLVGIIAFAASCALA